MLYRLAADAVLVLHLFFIIFVVFGGLLAYKWRWIALLHLPSVTWVVLLEFFGWICPLTPLEVELRLAGAQQAYSGSFIEHYLLPLIYPADLDRSMQFLLGGFVLVLNSVIYAWLLFNLCKQDDRNCD